MADGRMTRFDVELFEAAAAEGRREHRSARQQLEHWTRIGREFSWLETAARRRIVAAVRGEMPFCELTTEEQLVANVELDVAIRERAASTSVGRPSPQAEMTAVALDENGVLMQLLPAGSTTPTRCRPTCSLEGFPN